MKKLLVLAALVTTSCGDLPAYPSPPPQPVAQLRATIVSVNGAVVRGRLTNVGPDCSINTHVTVGGYTAFNVFSSASVPGPVSLRVNDSADYELTFDRKVEELVALGAGTAVKCP